MSDDVELLCCPFCGKPPRVCPDTSYGYAMVFCPDENECPVQPCADGTFGDGETVEDAKRYWNTRAAISSLHPPGTSNDK